MTVSSISLQAREDAPESYDPACVVNEVRAALVWATPIVDGIPRDGDGARAWRVWSECARAWIDKSVDWERWTRVALSAGVVRSDLTVILGACVIVVGGLGAVGAFGVAVKKSCRIERELAGNNEASDRLRQIGTWLKKRRTEVGMSQTELAFKCGTAASYVSTIECGLSRGCSADLLTRFERVLGPFSHVL